MGIKVSSTILASSQIDYVPVTITAGVEKLRAPEATATSTGEESPATGAAAALPLVTDAARMGLGGAALGMLVLANV